MYILYIDNVPHQIIRNLLQDKFVYYSYKNRPCPLLPNLWFELKIKTYSDVEITIPILHFIGIPNLIAQNIRQSQVIPQSEIKFFDTDTCSKT